MKITDHTSVSLTADELEMLRKILGAASYQDTFDSVMKVYRLKEDEAEAIAQFGNDLFETCTLHIQN